jgi:exopolysaccharide production protein ExoY
LISAGVGYQQRIRTECAQDSHATLYVVDRVAGCILAIAIVCASRRSPWIAHRRIGQNGRPFWMLKCRTMWGDGMPRSSTGFIERMDGDDPGSKMPGDPRVRGRLARFCRKYSLDELPQLIHVVAGQMSLVGPRPITRVELTKHYGEDAEEVTRMRPGITGLWQVKGRNRLTFPQRRRLDLFLARHFSARFYIRILLLTIPSAIRGTDAW